MKKTYITISILVSSLVVTLWIVFADVADHNKIDIFWPTPGLEQVNYSPSKVQLMDKELQLGLIEDDTFSW